MCSLSVATSNRVKDKDGNWTDATEWHKVVVWGATAENVAKYTKKGSKVHIEGRIQTRKWRNKDGVDQYTTEVVAEQVKFLDSKPRDEGAQSQQGSGAGSSGQAQRSAGQPASGGQRTGSGSGNQGGGGSPPYDPDGDIPF